MNHRTCLPLGRTLRGLSLVGASLSLLACDAAQPEPAPTPKPAKIAVPQAPTEVFRAALAEALRDPDPFVRAERLGAVLPTMGAGSVATVRETLDDFMVDLRATELDLLVRAWARFQPRAALDWAYSKSPPTYRPGLIYTALHTWTSMDPQAASSAAWTWGAESESLERVVPAAIVRGWHSHGDSPELRAFIRGLPAGILRQRALAAYIRVVTQTQGVEAIKRWAESLPEDDQRYKLAVFRMAATELTLTSLEAGLAWCEAHCDGEYGKNMRSRVARTWVGRDGPAAMKWLASAPPSFQRNLDIRLTYSRWIRIDPQAALAWLPAEAGESPPDWLQPALPPYARAVALKSPAAAIPWAEKISNEKARETILVYVARIWLKVDEAAAEQWLVQSPLSEEVRDQVRMSAGTRNPVPVEPEGSSDADGEAEPADSSS